MSRGGAAVAAAAAWRAVLSSAARNPSFRCRQDGGALEALLSPEKNELRTVRWLAASASTTTKEPILHRSATTLPRRCGASSSLCPALSIREWKASRRSFAAEPVTKEEKEKQKEKEEGDEDGGTGSDPTSSTSPTSSTPTSWRSAGWSLDSCATLPNAISAARALSAPFLFRAITRGEWELAGALLAFGAASDWADGASARFLHARKRKRKEREERADSAPSASPSSSSSSPLGTYLDPLADKVFIGAAVAAAAGWGGGDGGGAFPAFGGGGDDDDAAAGGEKGEEKGDGESQGGQRRWPLLPSWLAAAVIGRDVFLVGGSLFARLRQFEGGRWPGGPEFFRLVDDEKKKRNSSDENGGGKSSTRAAPRVRPLFVSKLNTALQFATVGAAVADSGGWLEEGIGRARARAAAAAAATGVGGEEGGGGAAAAEAAAAFASNLSGSDVVAGLAAATAAMTAVSGWAYASAYLKAKRREK